MANGAQEVLDNLNPPVALARILIRAPDGTKLLMRDGPCIVAVGLLWLCIAVIAARQRDGRPVPGSRWNPLRVIGNITSIVLGLFFGYGAWDYWAALDPIPDNVVPSHCFGSLLWFGWVPWLVSGCLAAAWGLALVRFGARDVIWAIRREFERYSSPESAA